MSVDGFRPPGSLSRCSAIKQGGKKDEGSTDPSGERKRVRFQECSSDSAEGVSAVCEEGEPASCAEVPPQASGLHGDECPPHPNGTLCLRVDRQPQATLRTVRSFLGIALEASVEERGMVLHVTPSGAHENARLEIEVQADPAEPATCSNGALLLFRGPSCSSSSDVWRLSCLYSMVIEHLDAADHCSIRRVGASRGSCSELFDSSFASEQEDMRFSPMLCEAFGKASPRRSSSHVDDIFEATFPDDATRMGASQNSLLESSTRSPNFSEVAKYGSSGSANTSVGLSSRSSPWVSEDSGGLFVKDTPSSLAWISATDSMWRVDVSNS